MMQSGILAAFAAGGESQFAEKTPEYDSWMQNMFRKSRMVSSNLPRRAAQAAAHQALAKNRHA